MNLIKLNKTVKFLLINLVFLVSFFARGAELNDLYQSSISVENQSAKIRALALKSAMRSVLLKVGGQEQVLDNPLIKQAIDKQGQFISQYRYFRQAEQLYINAQFDEGKINQLFQQAGLSLWGRLRPQILIWILDENNLSRTVVADSAANVLPQMIRDFSSQRGLPMMLPLMDIEDANTIQLSDFWGRFSEQIKYQSSRYAADALLVIRISNSSLIIQEQALNGEQCVGLLCQQSSSYVADWSLISDNQVFSQPYQGDNKQTLVQQILKDVADNIYQRYALSTSLNNDYIIDVANIDSLEAYVNVSQFLTQLSAIEQVTLVKAQGENYRFKLSLIGSKQALKASLRLNKSLTQYIDPLADNQPDDVPVFFWSQP